VHVTRPRQRAMHNTCHHMPSANLQRHTALTIGHLRRHEQARDMLQKSLAGCETDDQARKKDPMDSDTHLQTRSMFLLDEMHSTNHAAFDLTGRQATELSTYCCYQLCPASSLTKAAMLVACHSMMARNKAGQPRQASIG